MNKKDIKVLARQLEKDLFDKHGPMMSDDDLRKALGYSSIDALRQAISRKTAPIHIFSLEKRRGKYAFVKDVADWLAHKGYEKNEN